MNPDIERQIAEQAKAEELRREKLRKNCFGEEFYLPKRKAKYRNVRTEYTSIQGFTRTYDSKKEADYAAQLDNAIKAKLARWWIPQPSFPLPGGVTYRADFLVCYVGTDQIFDDNVRVVDVKGRDTQASKNKRKQVAALYGIKIEVV